MAPSPLVHLRVRLRQLCSNYEVEKVNEKHYFICRSSAVHSENCAGKPTCNSNITLSHKMDHDSSYKLEDLRCDSRIDQSDRCSGPFTATVLLYSADEVLQSRDLS